MEKARRKKIRLEGYNYASTGAYFVTVCVLDRYDMLWEKKSIDSNYTGSLSKYGRTIEEAIRRIPENYPQVCVDKYCIMPDHIHMILIVQDGRDGRMISAPTVSTIVGQMKRWVSRQIGFSLWQKSYYDRIIRNEEEYRMIWKYIDENPLKIRGQAEE